MPVSLSHTSQYRIHYNSLSQFSVLCRFKLLQALISSWSELHTCLQPSFFISVVTSKNRILLLLSYWLISPFGKLSKLTLLIVRQSCRSVQYLLNYWSKVPLTVGILLAGNLENLQAIRSNCMSKSALKRYGWKPLRVGGEQPNPCFADCFVTHGEL